MTRLAAMVVVAAVLVAAIFSDAARGGDPEPPVTAEQRGHWAFQPLWEAAIPPDVGGNGRFLNPVDAFIHARLAAHGMTFAPSADKAALLRRVTMDLIGLPPSPGQILAFLKDESPEAYERVVDRLLASPRHGERWAQHWLDAARFAESDGFEFDHERPDAWRYRDWVIQSFNADIGFADFARAQIAGDEIEPPVAAATGFLMAGPDMIDINLADERRHNFLNDMASTVGEVFLSLSVGCAQCHDHKSDPLSIHDFYRLRAFFDNTVTNPKKSRQLPGTVNESTGELPASYVRERGDFRRRGDQVWPKFPRVLNAMQKPVPPPGPGAASSMRRAALADWLVRPDNPLPFRVMANRFWLHHFGRGIVETPNDFGKLGGVPTHPRLLDWLAQKMGDRGSGFKTLHRMLVMSATYRQASRGESEGFRHNLAVDPENRLFSRMKRRRLSGEAIRDSILCAAGQLNLKAGGPGIRPPLPREVTSTLLKNQWNVTPDASEHSRRGIYLFVRRNLRFPMFDAFDRPDTNASCGRRLVSTTAPQALTLFNSEFARRHAEHLAAVVTGDLASPEEGVAAAYLRVFGRHPSVEEIAIASTFLAAQSAILSKEGIKDSAGAALADYCLGLLNSNEAVYID